MKTIRIAAIVPLGLMSLMNVGYILPSDPKHDTAVALAVLGLGLVGLVAAFGLARGGTWAIRLALVVAGTNLAAAVLALLDSAEGALIGLVISALALGLCFAAAATRTAPTTPTARRTTMSA